LGASKRIVAAAKNKKRLLAQQFCSLNIQSEKSFTIIMAKSLRKRKQKKYRKYCVHEHINYSKALGQQHDEVQL